MPKHLWRGSCLIAVIGFALARPAAQAPAPPTQASTSAVEITVLDRAGLVPGDLRPTDVTVLVDGKPRPVMWMRRVSRGPGAVSDAAARQDARSSGATTFAAEPSRTVLVIVDAASFVRGNERPALQVANSFLDRLGMSDRVAVVQIPLSPDQPMPLTTERSAVREALGRVAGAAVRDASLIDSVADIEVAGAAPADPAGENAVEDDPRLAFDQQSREFSADAAGAESEQPLGHDSASGLVSLLRALQPIPGRKVIALLSAGFAASSKPIVDEAASAAVAAHAVIYAFGLKDPGSNKRGGLDAAGIERLARATGGSFVIPGNKPDRTMDRVVAELSACYVVGIQRSDDDGGTRPRALRIETSRRDLTVRGAGSWFAGTSEVEDLVPAAPSNAEARDAAGTDPQGRMEYRGSGRASTSPEPSSTSARDGERGIALGRLFDYVEAYERQYSALVAEEDFRQKGSGQNVHLRSDFLLVKPEGSEEWTSFRDVYEVNGVPVRDREDRLRRLFLNPSSVAQAQLEAIRDESARHNIGPFERTINVPLLPLKFLSRRNRDRFRFTLASDGNEAGVRTWRVEYKELAGPTMVTDRERRDIFAHGWFLVDQMTGAIVESGLTLDRDYYQATVVVRYRRDDVLGMWVPAEMKETYKMAQTTWSMSPGTSFETELEGVATYSKFRRFQVKTEEKVTIPK